MNKTVKIVVCSVSFLLSPLLYAACNSALQLTAPDVIYTDNQDGTVTDEKTALVWQKCSQGLSGNTCQTGTLQHFNWKTAMDAVLTINQGGFAGQTDWRLPSVAELRSLVETACSAPAINATFFPATASASYWTSSPYVRGAETNVDAAKAWFISFDNGVELYEDKDKTYAIRLVRGN